MKKFLTLISFLLSINIAQANDLIIDPEPIKPVNANDFVTAPLEETEIRDDKIYFFIHSMCANCKDPFIYLTQNYPNVKFTFTDVKFNNNFNLYKQCAKKFGIDNSKLKIPFICMDNHFIMGWDYDSPRLFSEYLHEFNQKHPQY